MNYETMMDIFEGMSKGRLEHFAQDHFRSLSCEARYALDIALKKKEKRERKIFKRAIVGMYALCVLITLLL